MDNFDLKKYVAEGSIHQFGSDSARDLAMAKARFSNAILALDSDDMSTAEEVKNSYMELGRAMENHLQERFGDYNS